MFLEKSISLLAIGLKQCMLLWELLCEGGTACPCWQSVSVLNLNWIVPDFTHRAFFSCTTSV